MKKILEKNTLSKNSFIKLLTRHEEQCLKNMESKILFSQQKHESYMYNFFRHSSFDVCSKINIGNISGYIRSSIDIPDFKLSAPVTPEQFFHTLKHSPVPFVFVPENPLAELTKFCEGAFLFKEGAKEGILMNIEFATEVGVDFIESELLFNPEIVIYYIGFVYRK